MVFACQGPAFMTIKYVIVEIRKCFAHTTVGLQLIYSSELIGTFQHYKVWRISPHTITSFYALMAPQCTYYDNIFMYN